MLFFVFLSVVLSDVDVGILYSTWHVHASQLMDKVKEKGGMQLTTERVIRSNGKYTLNDVYVKYGLENGDIWNVEPAELGYYCLYTKRENETRSIDDCKNVTKVAERHAKLLVDAGIDYVAIDMTNWIYPDQETDERILRPTEVLLEEWKKLRDQGISTPKLAAWPCSPKAEDNTVWKWVLDNLYNKKEFDELIYRQDGKKVVFIPANDNCMNEEVMEKIRENGGRNDVTTVLMWAMFGTEKYDQSWWGFFSPCISPRTKFYTTSIVGEPECNQKETTVGGKIFEISASGSYMLAQCSLPFAAPGKLRGLTLQRLFKKILEEKPKHVFMSSFNELVGGRQPPAYKSNVAFNMGLPNDPQKNIVWVDTYAYEFSRDLEPSVEGGSRMWNIVSSCVHLYKNNSNCEQEPESLCCTTADKDIFTNVWSLVDPRNLDHLLTIDENEKSILVSHGNSIPGPSVFCVNSAISDGRDGPFMIYKVEQPGTIPLYRCYWEEAGTHFISTSAQCEGKKMESRMGYISKTRGMETLRELRRCIPTKTIPSHTHSLDLPCDIPDTGVLGYVR